MIHVTISLFKFNQMQTNQPNPPLKNLSNLTHLELIYLDPTHQVVPLFKSHIEMSDKVP